MSYPPHLMDALGRMYAKVALDRLIKDEMTRQAGPQDDARPAEIPATHYPEKGGSVDGPVSVESSDNREQLPPESRP